MRMPWTVGIALTAVFLVLPLEGAEAPGNSIRLKIVGADPSAPGMPIQNIRYKSHYFRLERAETFEMRDKGKPLSWYSGIYPGIDLISYGDEYQLEYLFALSPGTDPSLIKLAYGKPEYMNLNRSGHIVIRINDGEMIQSRPVAFLEVGDKKLKVDCRYDIAYDKKISLAFGRTFRQSHAKLNGTKMNLVPAGGQPGGPMYDFYIAKHEVANDQFVRFLNSAEANQETPRGANMHFQESGNVSFRPDDVKGKYEMFNILASRLVYDRGKPLGERYDNQRLPTGDAPYAKHPVSGVSWYGAIKYCNWLTLNSGRGEAQLCYSEGSDPVDWAPVTATNWVEGVFGPTERENWLSLKGFRLPMVDSQPPTITTNAYNEFYKAAAWSATTNRVYGFGRDTYEMGDGNLRSLAMTMGIRTLPVGFFNGTNRVGDVVTRPNENFYGIYDLTGNVAEWMSDRGRIRNERGRAVCGGSWLLAEQPLVAARVALPGATGPYSGMRVATTYLDEENVLIYILFSFYSEPEPPPKELPGDVITAIYIGEGGDRIDDEDEEGIMRKQPGESVVGVGHGVDPDAIVYNLPEEEEEEEEEIVPVIPPPSVYIPEYIPDPDTSPGGI